MSTLKGVPGVPMAALNAVADENARRVLQALVDGFNVRNGASGSGDAAFVTRAELSESTSRGVMRQALNDAAYRAAVDALDRRQATLGLSAGQMAQLLAQVDAQVVTSSVFTELGQRIDAIDLSVLQEQQERISAVSAVASDLLAEVNARVNLGTTLGGQITTLQNTTNTQATALTNLTTRVSGAEGSISTLQTTTGTLTSSLSALTTRVGTAESSITSLQTASGTQATNLTNLTTRVGTAETAITTLQTTTSTTASNLTALSTTVAGVSSRLTTEETTRANADNAITSQINTLSASVGESLAAINLTQTATTNNVAALTQTVTTMSATVGSNTAAIEQEAQTRAAADGTLFAQWTLRVDVNGRVSGFGLASDEDGVSDFAVRADRFAIAAPNDSTMPLRVPFTVLTTEDAFGNQPGVYMDMAMVRKASITDAYIGDVIQSYNFDESLGTGWKIDKNGVIRANDGYFRGNIEATRLKVDAAEIVKTLHLEGNAVTVPVSSQWSGDAYLHQGQITSTASSNFGGAPVVIIATITVRVAEYTAAVKPRIYRNGSQIAVGPQNSANFGPENTGVVTSTFVMIDNPGAGSFNYGVGAMLDGGDSYVAIVRAAIIALGVKK